MSIVTKTFDNADYSETGELMRFRLYYEGPLKSDGDAKHKHAVRRQFHPQLKELWRIYPSLNGEPLDCGIIGEDGEVAVDKPVYPNFARKIAEAHQVHGYKFVPLVLVGDRARVDLDILMLRPGPAGGVITQSGDIDNRMKTLFDALQIPAHSIGHKIPEPLPGEEMFYCLMADDALISKVTVENDALLRPLEDVKRHSEYVQLIITVEIKAMAAFNPRFAA